MNNKTFTLNHKTTSPNKTKRTPFFARRTTHGAMQVKTNLKAGLERNTKAL